MSIKLDTVSFYRTPIHQSFRFRFLNSRTAPTDINDGISITMMKGLAMMILMIRMTMALMVPQSQNRLFGNALVVSRAITRSSSNGPRMKPSRFMGGPTRRNLPSGSSLCASSSFTDPFHKSLRHQNRGEVFPSPAMRLLSTSSRSIMTLRRHATADRNTSLEGGGDRNWKGGSTGKKGSLMKDQTTGNSFTAGDEVTVEVVSFGPIGASVEVIALGHFTNNESLFPSQEEPPLARGLILQREIHMFRLSRNNVDVYRGEVLNAYVERVRENLPTTTTPTTTTTSEQEREQQLQQLSSLTRLDICLRPFGGTAKANQVSVQILEKLRQLQPGQELAIGDKSRHEEIGRYFPGVSKTAFKRALGNLFDQNKVWPSPYSIRLYSEADGLVDKKAPFPKRSRNVSSSE